MKAEWDSLQKESLLLCDENQRYEEKEEDFKIAKKIIKQLIGRVYWKEDFKDENTEKM